MRAVGGDEPRGGGTEHELAQDSLLAAHLNAAAVLFDGEYNARLDATAKVNDAGARADMRNGSRGAHGCDATRTR